MIKRFILLIFSGILLISSCSIAEEKHIDYQHNTSKFSLPADLHQLLTKEMLAIEKAMQELLSSIAKGNWQKTATIAAQIKASYIMKQSLTDDQKKQLHDILPEQFVKLDQSFHHYAEMLAHAAKIKNADVVNFYFYKLNDSCVQCHSSYAQAKFSGFADLTKKHHSH